jgi:hypothetical protein
MRTALMTAAGVVILVFTMRDVVHELFHPEMTGSMSRWVMHAVWKVFRAMGRIRRGAMLHAGPAVLIGVALTWAGLIVVGWALIYLPHLPRGFLAAPGLPHSERRGFFTAIYISIASVTTLSSGDLTPQTDALRYCTTIEALVGLVVFTAWITWVLSIYPVVAERRAFCREVLFLREVYPDPDRCIGERPRDSATQVLLSLTEQVISMAARLGQSRVSYYFQNDETDLTLPCELPYVLRLARAAQENGSEPGIRHHGLLLRKAVEHLVAQLGDQYLGLKDVPPERVFEALRRDHMLECRV